MNAALKNDKEKLMADYLLGELSEAERSRQEELYFADDDHFAELLAAEDELIEQYLSGTLPPAQRKSFAEHFLASPRRRRRVETVASVRRSATGGAAAFDGADANPGHPSARGFLSGLLANPGFRITAAAAVLLVVVGVTWLALREFRSRQGPGQTEHAEAQEPQVEPVPQTNHDFEPRRSDPAPLNSRSNVQAAPGRKSTAQEVVSSARSPAAQPATVTFMLAAGLTRGAGQERTIRLTRSTRIVILNLTPSADEYSSYDALIETPEGGEIWRRANLKPRRTSAGPLLSLSVNARSIRRGDFILTLNGTNSDGRTERAGQYSFRTVVE